jgi:hypothetical protein
MHAACSDQEQTLTENEITHLERACAEESHSLAWHSAQAERWRRRVYLERLRKSGGLHHQLFAAGKKRTRRNGLVGCWIDGKGRIDPVIRGDLAARVALLDFEGAKDL